MERWINPNLSEEEKREIEEINKLYEQREELRRHTVVLKIHAEDREMRYLNLVEHEDSNIIVYAQKTEFSSMADFLAKVLAFLDSTEEDYFYDENYWTETYRNVSCSPVKKVDNWKLTKTGFRRWKEGEHYKEKHITAIIEPVISVMDVGEQLWNDNIQVLETDTDYVFYNFFTSA